jgi:hypothetical protein
LSGSDKTPTNSSCNQLLNIARKPAKQTAKTKHGIRIQQAGLATEDIAEFAIQWLKRGQSQKVRGGYPAGEIECVELTADFPIAGDNDGLVNG